MPSWIKVAMCFVMGLVMVVGLGDNSGVDAGWFPGKLAGRVIVNGVHRRQERRATRREARSCGGAEQVEQVQVQASGCHAAASGCHGVPVDVPAPIETTKAPAPVSVEPPELSPEEEQRIRDSIADLRDKLHLLENMIEIRKKLTSR